MGSHIVGVPRWHVLRVSSPHGVMVGFYRMFREPFSNLSKRKLFIVLELKDGFHVIVQKPAGAAPRPLGAIIHRGQVNYFLGLQRTASNPYEQAKTKTKMANKGNKY